MRIFPDSQKQKQNNKYYFIFFLVKTVETICK